MVMLRSMLHAYGHTLVLGLPPDTPALTAFVNPLLTHRALPRVWSAVDEEAGVYVFGGLPGRAPEDAVDALLWGSRCPAAAHVRSALRRQQKMEVNSIQLG